MRPLTNNWLKRSEGAINVDNVEELRDPRESAQVPCAADQCQ